MIEFDPLLVERARDGGPDLDTLVRTMWPHAYRVAYGVLRDRGLAEDCAQDACAAVIRSLPALHDPRAFRSWMYRTVMNHAITIGRRERRRVAHATTESPIAPDRSELVDLERAIAALPVEQRAVVILHYYAGLTSSELAGMSGLRSSTIRFRLMLARRALRKNLGDNVDGARPSEGVSHA